MKGRGDTGTRGRGDGLRSLSASPRLRVPASVIALLLILIPDVASACSVCWGASDSQMVKAANNGVLVMLGIVAFVQIGFVALFVSFWRRARAIRKRREQFRIINGLAR